MPRRFTYFLITAQVILSFLHWLLYLAILRFFPALAVHATGLLVLVLVMSVSFLLLATAVHYVEFLLLDFAYIFSGTWLIFVGYLGLLSLPAVLLSLIFPKLTLEFGTIALTIACLLVIYGLINARIIRVKQIRVSLPNLPAFWKGKTALMVSDMHLGNVLRKRSARKIVKAINRQNPDIVFIPGDLFDGAHTHFEAYAEEFKNLKAPLGSYFSSGNHELYAGYQECENAIRHAGIKILEDEKTAVQGLQIIGLAYRHETDESVKQKLRDLGFDPNCPSILLKHVPNHLNSVEEAGISLQLSGHAHMAQVWPGRYITKKIFKGYDYGLNKFKNLQIYTSSGVGTWGPPLRVFTPAEIVKITFQ